MEVSIKMIEKWIVDSCGTLINTKTFETFDCMEDIVDVLNELSNENLSLKLAYGKCRDCKYANMYTPYFAFLVADPKCELNVKSIHSESNACEDFQLCGRRGR